MDELLPIGSVVSLGDSGQIYSMILGYYLKNDSQRKIYDYIGVLYPFGITGDSDLIPFDRTDIHEVLFQGYQSDNCKAVCKALPKIMQHISYENIHEIESIEF